MSDGISILEEIKRGGYEASLMTTFNAYLPFYEDVVLRHLSSNGVRHNILMMDGAQATRSIQSHPPRLAGRHYTLIPMRSAQAFHPKVIFLAGKNKGALLVGSHNMTLSGFGYNRELTNLVRVMSLEDKEAVSLLQNAWQQIVHWVSSQATGLPMHIVEMVTKTTNFAPWLKDHVTVSPQECVMISSRNGAPSLWGQLKNHFEGQASRVIVTGAFFDSELKFIKRIQEELNPQELVVGIDPETVQMPSTYNAGYVKFTNCRKIGVVGKEEDKVGYLHAKAIVVETANGGTILAIGSANPSFPAWLSDGGSGNIEAMLLRKGDNAAAAARELGLLDIPEMPSLSKQDWLDVTKNWQTNFETDKLRPSRALIVLALDGGISFDTIGGNTSGIVQCEVIGQEMNLLASCTATLVDGKYFAAIPEEIVRLSCFIRFEVAGSLVTCIVQHQKMIEENSRTGPQRRFREALASLSTDSPDLETLIQCVDKIIFDKAGVSSKVAEKGKPHQFLEPKPEHETAQVGVLLSVDIIDTKKTKKKFRLRQSDDLAYLLDLLIYHLKEEVQANLDTTLEKRDARGRSEEEQVGAEDEDGQQEDGQKKEELAAKTLSLCHHKVRTLIFRMERVLRSLGSGGNTESEVIVKLTAVLAVLRQLRHCDGKVSWIKPRQTSVPMELRKQLFEGIARTLFEAPFSIIYPSHGLANADELARLKGLILWLAWDSGIRTVRKRPYNEQADEKDVRIRNNSLMVALAQLVRQDEVIEDEAKHSIAPMCSIDMDWLNWILLADKRLSELISDPQRHASPNYDNECELAINPAKPDLGVRMVLNRDDNNTSMSYFAAGKDHIVYKSSALRFSPFELVFS